MSKSWLPSELERKCLGHLDAPGSWGVLRREEPAQDQVLPWGYFRRVFGFNLILFGPILIGLFLVLELTSGMPPADIRADLPIGILIAAIMAAGMSVYVTHLYRKSWNGRARYLLQAE